MTMITSEPGTGTYLVTVQLADSRTLEYAGGEYDYTDLFGFPVGAGPCCPSGMSIKN